MHRGLDKFKHMMEDAYDTAPQPRSGISSWFSSSRPSATSEFTRYAGGKMGQKLAETFTGKSSGYGRSHGPSFLGYEGNDEGFFSNILHFFEYNILGGELGMI